MPTNNRMSNQELQDLLNTRIRDFTEKTYTDMKHIVKKNPTVDINLHSERGTTILSHALEYSDILFVEWLLNNPNLDLNKHSRVYMPAIEYAIKTQDYEILKRLIARPDFALKRQKIQGTRSTNHLSYLVSRAYSMSELGTIVNNEKLLDVVKLLLEKYDLTINDGILHYAIRLRNYKLVQLLLARPDIDINDLDYYKNTPLAVSIEFMTHEITKLLLERPDIDVSIPPNTNSHKTLFDLFIYKTTSYLYREPFSDIHKSIIHLFLNNPKIDKNEIIQNAKNSVYYDEINEFILQDTNATETKVSMWEGWTRSDISQMNDLFSQSIPENSLMKSFNSNDPQVKSGEVPGSMVESLFSFCPICLQYIKHEAKTCMYMSHNCRKNPENFYHTKLYEKYAYFKSDMFGRPTHERTVTWCTLCGRICKEHQHYSLTSYTSSLPTLLPGGNPYETNCQLTNGGGGLPEKVWRYRKLREFANELNQLKGQLTKQQAYERLVEAMWDAPLQQKGLINLAMSLKKPNLQPRDKVYEWSPSVECVGSSCKSATNLKIGPINWRKTAKNKAVQRHRIWQEPERKEWNLSSNVFPKPLTNNNTTNTTTGLRPYTGELPIVHTSPPAGWTNFMGIDDETLIQFRHVEADGTINFHETPGEQISQFGLVGLLKTRLGNPSSEEFGKCWQFYTEAQQQQLSDEEKLHICTANLHPDEVDAALDMTDEDHKQTAKNYRTAYTNRFGSTVVASGGRRCRKTRKTKHRKTIKHRRRKH